MNKKLLLVALVFLVGNLSLSSYTSQKFPSPEAFAEKVFASLKAKNLENYKALFMQKQEYIDIIEKSYFTDSKKAKEKDYLEDELKSLMTDIKPSFDKVIEQGEELGITWGETSFKEAEYNLSKKDNIFSCTITVFFEYKDLIYKIKLGKSFLANDVWKMKAAPGLIK